MSKIKEYLDSVKYLDRDIESRLAELNSLKAILLSSPKLVDDKVQTSNSTRIDDTYVKIMELEESIGAKIDDLVALKKKVSSEIDSLDDRIHRIVLREKYINMKSFDDIAQQIPCTVRQAQRYHGEALVEFSKVVIKCHKMS